MNSTHSCPHLSLHQSSINGFLILSSLEYCPVPPAAPLPQVEGGPAGPHLPRLPHPGDPGDPGDAALVLAASKHWTFGAKHLDNRCSRSVRRKLKGNSNSSSLEKAGIDQDQLSKLLG